MHVFTSGIASFREGVSASKFSGLELGLTTLARLADDAGTAAFDRFQSIWGGELGSRILARADEIGEQLVEEVASPETRVESEETRVANRETTVTSHETRDTGESPVTHSSVESRECRVRTRRRTRDS